MKNIIRRKWKSNKINRGSLQCDLFRPFNCSRVELPWPSSSIVSSLQWFTHKVTGPPCSPFCLIYKPFTHDAKHRGLSLPCLFTTLSCFTFHFRRLIFCFLFYFFLLVLFICIFQVSVSNGYKEYLAVLIMNTSVKLQISFLSPLFLFFKTVITKNCHCFVFPKSWLFLLWTPSVLWWPWFLAKRTPFCANIDWRCFRRSPHSYRFTFIYHNFQCKSNIQSYSDKYENIARRSDSNVIPILLYFTRFYFNTVVVNTVLVARGILKILLQAIVNIGRSDWHRYGSIGMPRKRK